MRKKTAAKVVVILNATSLFGETIAKQTASTRCWPGIERLRAGYVKGDLVDHHIREGGLVSVIEDWCPHFPGLHAK
jgi:hypothetical protein